MTAKKPDYIIIYSFLCASILSIAVLVRMFAVTELKMDEFSGLMVFFVTCLLLGGFYFSFQSIIIHSWSEKKHSSQIILIMKFVPFLAENFGRMTSLDAFADVVDMVVLCKYNNENK